MNRHLVEAGLWSAAAIALISAVAVWRRANRVVPAVAPIIWPVAPVEPPVSPDSARVLLDQIVGGDVFRLDRQPAQVAYAQRADTLGAGARQAASVKPRLMVAGVIGGPPWAALLDGIPGHDVGLVVHKGDSIAGLHIGRITPNVVTVTGMDTIWRLSIRRAWR